MITNKRFAIKTDKPGPELLDTIESFFAKKLSKGESVLRFACVDKKDGKLIIDATILKEGSK